MEKKLHTRRLAGVFACCLGSPLHSGTFDAQVLPKAADNFYEARARLWLPEPSSKIEAILILLNGTDSDGRSAVSQPEWQEFARRQHLALVGCYFRGDGEPYEDASCGSGRTLLEMLAELAKQSGRSEIQNAPLLFVGHSAGAMFSYNFTCWKPETVLAFVSLKSGPIAPTANEQAWSVPGLFIVGDSDLSGRVRTTATAYLEASRKGISRWALAVEPGGGHGSSQAIRVLVQAYLKGVLELSDGRAAKASPGTFGDCGIIKSLAEPIREREIKTLASETAWLPGAPAADAWQKFVGPVRLAEFAQTGGMEDRPEIYSQAALLDFGDLDLRQEAGDFQQTFAINNPLLADATYTADDANLRVLRLEKKGSGEPALTLELRKGGLRPGYYRTSVKATSRSGESVSLPVRARISAGYAAKPSSVYVGVIARGSVSEMPIAIVSDSGQPLKIGKVHSSRPEFAAARETGTGKLLCRFDGGRGLGNQSGHFDVVLAENPPRQLKIPFIAWVSKKEAL